MPAKLGIVAGGGALAAQIISACEETGREFFVVALEGHADAAELPAAPDAWIRIGNAGTGIEQFRNAGVSEIVLAGRVRRPSLKEIRPDAWTAKVLAKIGWSMFGDDGAIRKVIGVIENEGFRVVAPETLLTDLLATEGTLGRHQPSEPTWRDIRRGIEVVKSLGALDVGQAVIVQQGFVLGVEAVEGTDAMIARCGPLAREGDGGVLVKASKPGQERRGDLPTIGPETVSLARDAGLVGIAVEAGGALIVDRARVIADADAAGLFVVGFGTLE